MFNDLYKLEPNNLNYTVLSQRAYFENISNVIKSELLKACHTIKIAVAWIKDDTIIKVLEKKALEGVLIELFLVDDKINQSSSIHHNEQIQNHIIIYKIEESDVLMHNKFCIIDDKLVITGSYNWTNKAQNNFENIIVIDQKDIVISYCKEFKKLKERLRLFTNSGNHNNLVKDYSSHLNLARNKVKQNLLIEASRGYILLLDSFPQKEEIYSELYIIQYKLKHFEGAIQTWEKYQANYKDHFEAHIKKTGLYKQLKDYCSAEKEIEIGIRKYPSKSTFFIRERADLWFDQIRVTKGTIQKTFDCQRNSITLKSNYSNILSYYEKERTNNIQFTSLALRDYRSALEAQTNYETVKFLKLRIAELMFYNGELLSASALFKELFDSGFTYALYTYIGLLKDNEQYKSAIKYSNLFLSKCQNKTERWLVEGIIKDSQRSLTFWGKIF